MCPNGEPGIGAPGPQPPNGPNWFDTVVKLLGVIIAILTFLYITGILAQLLPHHVVDVRPSFGELSPGESINTTIYVTKSGGIPGIWELHEPISLGVKDADDGVAITFAPNNQIPEPLFISSAQIRVSPDASNTSHVITIVGNDGHKNLRETTYILQIGRTQGAGSNPLPTPAGAISPEKTVDISNYYYPSGWMGDIGDIFYLPVSRSVPPHTGLFSIEIRYSPRPGGTGWSGIYWQYPENNWGDKPGGYNLSGYSTLSFWARGKNGGEQAEFKTGGLNNGNYPDTLQPARTTSVISLTKEWERYTIDLRGADLGRIGGGFVWVTSRDQNPSGCTIFLDDIALER